MRARIMKSAPGIDSQQRRHVGNRTDATPARDKYIKIELCGTWLACAAASRSGRVFFKGNIGLLVGAARKSRGIPELIQVLMCIYSKNNPRSI